jgi:hypothetical protein
MRGVDCRVKSTGLQIREYGFTTRVSDRFGAQCYNFHEL